MPYIAVDKENSGDVSLYYEDHGQGKPVVLIHGWPLSGDSWEKQLPALLGAGYRVITYDRRGFGSSSRPVSGYDYDTLAEDLRRLMLRLDLRGATLVGFSMGGGEVARYLAAYGGDRVEKAVFLSAIPPFLLKTPDNPAGVESSVFEGILKALVADRPAFLNKFLNDFYNFDLLEGKLVSKQVIWLNWNIAAGASARGTIECVKSWATDFRKDLSRIDVPVLIVHGDADRILPISATGIALHNALPGSRFVVVKGGPHGILWTHAGEVNQALIDFLGATETPERKAGAQAVYAR